MSRRFGFCGVAVLYALAVFSAPAQAQVQVSVRTVYLAETIFISDLTPTTTRKPVDLLAFTVVGPPGGAQQVQLQVTVTRERPAAAEIFRGTSGFFALNAGPKHFTSGDLFARGRDVSITDYTIAGEGDPGKTVGHSGRLPAGTYVIALDVLNTQGVRIGGGEARLEVGNPTRLALIAPGAPVSSAPPTVNTPALRFVWSPDGPTAGNLYKVRVVRTNGAVSGEEAMQGRASWEGVTTNTSELYPASATAIPLEPGATYAWQVTREVRSSGGVELIQSPIFWFRVGGMARTTSASGEDAFALRLTELLRMLGMADQVAGYRPVSAKADGQPIALATLEQLLAAIAAGEVALISAIVR